MDKNDIDYFTEEYHNLYSLLDIDSVGVDGGTSSSSFREKKSSQYECLAIEIVHEKKCQLSCEWCYVGQRGTKKADLKSKPVSFDTIKNIINQAVQKNNSGVRLFGRVVFIGGEPTLNPYLEDMVKYALHKNLTPIIVTNGIKLFNKDYAKSICQPGSQVVIHIPFFNKKGDKVMNRKSGLQGYDRILKKSIANLINIRKIYSEKGKEKVEIIGSYVLNKYSLAYALKAHIFCRKNDIIPFFERVRIANDSCNKKLIPVSEEVKKVLLDIFEYDKEHYMDLIEDREKYLEKKYLAKMITYMLSPSPNSTCTMTQTGLHIKYTGDYFGDTVSCCGQTISHGNVTKNSLKKILKEKEKSGVFTEQKKFISGPCASCAFYDLIDCQGGCRGNANYTFNCPRASDPQCFFIKEEVRKNKILMTPQSCEGCLVADQCQTV